MRKLVIASLFVSAIAVCGSVLAQDTATEPAVEKAAAEQPAHVKKAKHHRHKHKAIAKPAAADSQSEPAAAGSSIK